MRQGGDVQVGRCFNMITYSFSRDLSGSDMVTDFKGQALQHQVVEDDKHF